MIYQLRIDPMKAIISLPGPGLRFVCLMVLLGLSPCATKAATVVWANNAVGNADWTTATNWDHPTLGDTAPANNVTTDIAAFGTVSGAARKNPNLSASRSVTGITISNSDADYSITRSGSEQLTLGASGLVITGGGTTAIAPVVILGASQTWDTGATALTLSNGLHFNTNRTLTLANGTAVEVQGTVRNSDPAANSTLTFDGAGSMTISGDIIDLAGSPVRTSGIESSTTFTGTLRLTGNNSFSKPSLIWRTGVLELGSNTALGTVAGGGEVRLGTFGTNNPVSILTIGAFTVDRSFLFNVGNAVRAYTIGGTHTSGTSVFTGNFNLGADGTVTGDGTGTATSPTGGLHLTAAAGGTVDFSGLISGTDDVLTTPTGSGTAYAGSKIFKDGDGVVRFTRADGNTYAGGTEVTAGTFLANNTSGSATGAGAVLVDAAGTLGGKGTVGSGTSVVTVNGTLNPGDSTLSDSRDAFTINGSLLLGSAATTNLEIGSLSDLDKIIVTGLGAVTLDGTINLDFSTFASANFATGFTLDLFDWTSTVFSSFDAAMDADLNFISVNYGGNTGSWDTSLFTSTGVTSGQISWIAGAVPEPGRALLVLGGVVCLLLRRRR